MPGASGDMDIGQPDKGGAEGGGGAEAKAARERKAAAKKRRAELVEEVQFRLHGGRPSVDMSEGTHAPLFNADEEEWIVKKLAKRRVQAYALETAAEAERTAAIARGTAAAAAAANQRLDEVRAQEAAKAAADEVDLQVELYPMLW